MIVSDQKRFVLLAPWKTATSTAHLRLQAYNNSPYSRFFDYNPYLQRVVHQHITYAEFTVLPESRKDYFVGTFVRNPYDRVYSGFLQLQRDIQHHPSAPFPHAWIKTSVMRQLADNFAQLAAAEFDFDKWFALVQEHQIYEVGRNASFPLHPAHYWTGVDGMQKVDFVGRTEHFEQDFGSFCRQVHIMPAEWGNANISDDLQGPTGCRHLKRMNVASISKINTIFSADFELFGYEKHSTSTARVFDLATTLA